MLRLATILNPVACSMRPRWSPLEPAVAPHSKRDNSSSASAEQWTPSSIILSISSEVYPYSRSGAHRLLNRASTDAAHEYGGTARGMFLGTHLGKLLVMPGKFLVMPVLA
jgi:hypothetical protein